MEAPVSETSNETQPAVENIPMSEEEFEYAMKTMNAIAFDYASTSILPVQPQIGPVRVYVNGKPEVCIVLVDESPDVGEDGCIEAAPLALIVSEDIRKLLQLADGSTVPGA
jgi:hypothetical protein